MLNARFMLGAAVLAALVSTSACQRKAPIAAPTSATATATATATVAEPGLPAIRCTPAFTAEQCAAANAALARDAAELAADAKVYGPAAAAKAAEIEASLPDPAALAKVECTSQRDQLAALQRMLNPPPGEIVSPQDAAALPALIARTERYLAKNCS